MESTVAKEQGSGRETVAERSSRQTTDHRKTKRQRGGMQATSVRVNAKSKIHQDASSRAAWHGRRAHVLTQGDLFESQSKEQESAEATVATRRSESSAEQRAEGATAKRLGTYEPEKPAHPSAEHIKLCTNPNCPNGAAIVSGKERATPDNMRNLGHRRAMQEVTMERAVEASNWEAALSAVERNDGAAGPDGLKSKELREHLARHGEGIRAKLLRGSFQPSAARRKEIEKSDGGIRPLSIPNVVDRFVQQLLLQTMQPVFEPTFSESSYGFRPGRSAHEAIRAAQKHAREGRDWVVDMDITKFFDHVNHDILMARVARVVRDKRMLQLIGRFLRAGVVLVDGCKVRSKEGTPQGGPLSPLLANIYLDQLDKELESRGLKHVRYADDCNIYVRSERAAQSVMSNVSKWISQKLKLQINADKSGIGRAWERKFLGFILTITLLLSASPQAIAKFKDQVRSKWDARQPLSSEQLRDQWRNYQRGWWAYYGQSEANENILRLSGWVRRHIRKCFWLRWHNASGRYAALRRQGLPRARCEIARCSRGAWRMARHPAMQTALSNKVLKHHGFITPLDLAG
jgi:RNA-directed DNA polymerase